MLILIEKDAVTRIPKEVTPDQAEAFATDFPVHVVGEDGSTVSFAEWKALQEVKAPEEDKTEAEDKPEAPEVPTEAVQKVPPVVGAEAQATTEATE
jgi:hypothetical protein